MVANPPPAGFPAEMLVGFSFAGALMFTWIAIQRDRFIKFWYFWGKPPYKSAVKIGFQSVFALWAVGATWHFIDVLLKFRSALNWKQVAMDALLWSAIIVLMVHAVEWMARRRATNGKAPRAKG